MRENLKILLTADTVGGVWTYAVDLAQALAPHGVQIALATLGAPLHDAQRAQLRALPHVRLYESAFKLEWMDEPWEDVRRADAWLLEIEREFAPDVVHLNGFANGAAGFSAPVLIVGHSCVLSWWEACRGESAPRSWDHYWWNVERGLHAADLVAAPTHAMLDALHRHYGPLPRAVVIPNGRSRAKYAAAGARQAIVLSAGRLWDEAKNIAAVCAVAPRIGWPLYVAGDDRHPSGQQQQPLVGVNRLGRLNEAELADWYRRAAIYALPARYEPFGLSILEAALSGCALVLGDIPSLRETWDGAADFVHPDDRDALAGTIGRLIADADYRGNRARQAAARANFFTPAAMAEHYLMAYQDLARSVSACAS